MIVATVVRRAIGPVGCGARKGGIHTAVARHGHAIARGLIAGVGRAQTNALWRGARDIHRSAKVLSTVARNSRLHGYGYNLGLRARSVVIRNPGDNNVAMTPSSHH